MKILKLNITLLVAVLVMGITFTTQASIFGKKVITRCYTQVSLKNAAGSATASLDGTVANPPGCTAAKAQVTITPYVTSVGASLASGSDCPPSVEVFCCVEVTEIPPADPGYAGTPFLDLGEGQKKYKVLNQGDVYCKIQLGK